jgi:1-acyl-sn-glycerol-3-phosphate acyltransferase
MSGTEPNRWWRIGLALVLPVSRSLLRIRSEGFERVPSRGPALLAFDHVSVLDGPVLAIEMMRRARRTTRFLVAAEIFGAPMVGPILRRYEQIPIRRGHGDDGALDLAVKAVREGALAAIAPEGRVNPQPEQGHERIRSGAARIALASEAPLLPVGIWGTQDRWPHRGPRFGRPLRPTVGIAVGPPILPVGDPADVETVAALTARLAEALERQVARAKALARATASTRS